jgi:hypothetical protein
MARRADIKSPTTLRKGIPPQLERIVMHALAKVPGERYQSAGDFATDLERFLHAYSPVFTATKVATMIKTIVGDPIEVPDDPEIEIREGPIATHTLNTEDLIHSSDELDHENSVIFRVADLKPKQPEPKPPRQPTGPVPAGPRITRQADIKDIAPPPVPVKLPTPAAGVRQPTARAQTKSRLADEAAVSARRREDAAAELVVGARRHARSRRARQHRRAHARHRRTEGLHDGRRVRGGRRCDDRVGGTAAARRPRRQRSR